MNGGRALEDVLHEGFPWCEEWVEELRGLFRAFVDRKQANAALDYDDLLLYWHALMQEPALAAEIGAQLRSRAGRRIPGHQPAAGRYCAGAEAGRCGYHGGRRRCPGDLFIPRRHGRTTSWISRIAASRAATVIALERNYRSSQPLLDAANALIAGAERQYRKTLIAARGDGARPRLVTVPDDRQQADYVVQGVLQRREAGTLLRRQAVLFRSSHHSDWLEIELMRPNIPYVKYGGLRFLEAAHVKDLLAVLRWADNPQERPRRVPRAAIAGGHGPGQRRARAGSAFAAAGFRLTELVAFEPPAAAADPGPFREMLAGLADPSAAWAGQIGRVRAWYEPQLPRLYESAGVRAADLDMLEQLSPQYATREHFLTELTLDPPSASGELAGRRMLDEDYLVLSTVHSAKGQEWDAVYVLNVTDGNFPSEFATGTQSSKKSGGCCMSR